MANANPVRSLRTIHNVNYIEPKPDLHTERDALLSLFPFTNSPTRNSRVAKILFRTPEVPGCLIVSFLFSELNIRA